MWSGHLQTPVAPGDVNPEDTIRLSFEKFANSSESFDHEAARLVPLAPQEVVVLTIASGWFFLWNEERRYPTQSLKGYTIPDPTPELNPLTQKPETVEPKPQAKTKLN